MQVSIVSYSEVIKDNDSFRIDAEFFKKDILKLESKIKQNKWDYLGNLSQSIINFGAYSLCNNIVFKKEGVPYLNVGDISIGIIHYTNAVKIDKNLSINILSKSLVKDNQVLLTIAGTIGNAAIAFDPPIATNSNQAIANIEIKKSLSPFYTAIYLNCKYGKGQSKRLTISSVQPNLLLTQVKRIKTFIPSNSFQLYIELIYKNTLTIHKLSRKLYQEAEKLLLEELGLLDYKAKHTLTFVKNFSDTKEAGRIDAEYFQPKYDKIIKFIKDYKNGWNTLEDLCLLVGHPSNPPYSEIDAENKTFIVAQKHMGDYCLSDDYWNANDAKYTNNRFVEKNKQYILQKEDLVLYTVGAPPHIGKANLIFEETIPSTIGSFVTLVRVNKEKINPYYLVVLLNSTIGPQLTNRFQCGMVQQYIYPKDLVKIIIPLLPKEKQLEIQQKVTESFQLRKQSKQLLEIAKKGVEKAIEQDEEKALSWMDKEVKKLGLP